MRLRRVLGIGVAAVVTALSGAWVLAPETVRPWLSRGRVWAESVPRPVVLAVGGLVVLLAWLVAIRVLAGLVYRVWTRLWPRLKWVLETVLPDSPLVKFATGVMILLTMTVVIVGALPTLLDTSNTTAENITGGADGVAEQLTQQGLTSNWGDVVEGDTASGRAACREKRVSGPDSDGDGLPDRWEVAGETPAGAALPGADPQRKDLYVQANYGADIEPLSKTERDQLRAVWGQMPVENPDGSTGITIHVDDSSERAGGLGERAVFESSDSYDRYYTDSRLGPRHCVYHQVVYGQLQLGNTVGYGSVPGYVSIVEGRQAEEYETTYTPRVGVTTHELLHNVAGRVDGRTHTSSGWLRGGSDEEYLSRPTARELNESGLFGPTY